MAKKAETGSSQAEEQVDIQKLKQAKHRTKKEYTALEEQTEEATAEQLLQARTLSVLEVPINDVFELPQLRRNIRESELQELADDILANGQAVPIMVRPEAGEQGTRYRIVYGHRRWHAMQRAELPTIRALVAELTDREVLYRQWSENTGRRDLNPIDLAHAIRFIMDFEGWGTPVEFATNMNMAAQSVRDRLALLELIPEAQEAIAQGQLPSTYGVTMSRLNNSYQTIVYQELLGMNHPTLEWYRRRCNYWVERQNQAPLPSGDLEFEQVQQQAIQHLIEQAAEAAQNSQSSTANVPQYEEESNLPVMPTARSVGIALERYIAILRGSGNTEHQQAGRIVAKVYNELRRLNLIRTQ